MNRLSVGWVTVLAIIVVCGLVDRGRAADEPKAAFDTIALTSSGGFTGRGSGKAFTVDAEGKFVANTHDKKRVGTLKPEELKQLRERLAAVNWKEIMPSYPGKGADFFQDDLMVKIAGKSHETHVSEQVERKHLPQDLGGLLTLLDELYNQYKP